MIAGVMVKKLSPILDERGYLMEILRSDEDFFSGFGQCYITTCFPGVIKAWHLHQFQQDNICAVHGNIKLVVADTRKGSDTCGVVEEFFIGSHAPSLVKVPPGLYHGFTSLGNKVAVVLNIPDRPYLTDNPDECRLPIDTEIIQYHWPVKNR